MKLKEIDCEGKITRINHHELFYSKKHNYYNSIIYGLPFQLSHQNVEYTIRLEVKDPKTGIKVMDFCLYGDYMGLFHVGDVVSLVAYEHKGRKIVKAIYNKTTDSRVKPELQIPAWIVRLKLIVPVSLLTLFLSVYTGLLYSTFWGIVMALFCIVVSVIIFFIMFIKDSVEQ